MTDWIETRRIRIGASPGFEPDGFGDLRLVPGKEAAHASELDLFRRTLRSLLVPLDELAARVARQDEEHELWDLSVVIWTGILIQYARCFDGTSRFSLRAEDVFGLPSLLAMHREAMTHPLQTFGS